MPRYRVGQYIVRAGRLTLTPREVAGILRVRQQDVVASIERGELSDVGRDNRRRLDPDEVARLVEQRVQETTLPSSAMSELAELVASSS